MALPGGQKPRDGTAHSESEAPRQGVAIFMMEDSLQRPTKVCWSRCESVDGSARRARRREVLFAKAGVMYTGLPSSDWSDLVLIGQDIRGIKIWCH